MKAAPKLAELSDSRTALLDAAELLFARQGFATTTIKQIAAEAGVNSALLYYYFADKETLYRAMLARVVTTLAATISAAIGAEADPERLVRLFVRSQAEHLLGHPHLPRLLVRELIDHEARHAWDLIPQLTATSFARLREVIRSGQRSGRFRADVDPVFAAIHTVALVAYAAIARPAVARMLDLDRADVPPEVMREYADHAAEFALAAMRAGGTEDRT
ncbi:MAG TPA: TetR family transcriptional regulator [Gemmatimonadaceae bacterium]|nr:TetR family transcriptional regulator [Gemmatimonadaceae bacterium]